MQAGSLQVSQYWFQVDAAWFMKNRVVFESCYDRHLSKKENISAQEQTESHSIAANCLDGKN